jgi:LacI family transcriptional regulator
VSRPPPSPTFSAGAATAPHRSRSRRGPRLAGYRKALTDAGLELDDRLLMQTGMYRDSMYAAELEALGGKHRPDAVLSSTDRGAIAALWAAARLDIDVPGELAIVGMGNPPRAR